MACIAPGLWKNQGAWDSWMRIEWLKLWRETESWWELDERRDLEGSWYYKRSERYGGDQYDDKYELNKFDL